MLIVLGIFRAGDDLESLLRKLTPSAVRGRAMRRAEAKKKARPRDDAPSNKTYGNCLLGFHCSQKDPAGNRAIA